METKIRKKAEKAIVDEKPGQGNLELVEHNLEVGKEIFKSTVIRSAEDLKRVSDRVKHIKQLGKEVEERKDRFVAPAKAIIAEAKDIFDEAIAWFKNAERELKGKATAFMLEQERKAAAEQAKIAAKVESGKMSTEKAVEKIENMAPTGGVQTDNSAMQLRKRWNAYITHPNLVPEEYWVIDENRVRKEALERHKAGLPQIPGVEMRQDATSASL
ncbi:MAG: hypothetical protein KGJ13_08770 [Patescibacteria group bacterium]|nr:hypothetical protein [Patescibacteria group bacterium]